MEGRDTPSRGLDITARFLAAAARARGRGAGRRQRHVLPAHRPDRRKVDPERRRPSYDHRSGGAAREAKPRSFTYGDDFLAAAVSGVAEGSLIYVGHGYVVKEKNLDAYKGLDVTGKILVSHSGYPSGVSRSDVRGPSGERWESRGHLCGEARRERRDLHSVVRLSHALGSQSQRVERGRDDAHGECDVVAGRRNRKCRRSRRRRRCCRRCSRTRRSPRREIFRRAQTNEPAEGVHFERRRSRCVSASRRRRRRCRRRTSSRSCGAAIRS